MYVYIYFIYVKVDLALSKKLCMLQGLHFNTLGVHRDFPQSTYMHEQNIGTHICAEKVFKKALILESCEKKLREF